MLLLVLALVLLVPQVANGAAAANCAGSGRPQVLVRVLVALVVLALVVRVERAVQGFMEVEMVSVLALQFGF